MLLALRNCHCKNKNWKTTFLTLVAKKMADSVFEEHSRLLTENGFVHHTCIYVIYYPSL